MVRALLAQAPKPGPHEPPLLRRLHKRATNSIITAWRMHYALPLTDPRVQAITEEEAAEDLLEVMYHRNVTNPDLALSTEDLNQLRETLAVVSDTYQGSELQRQLLAHLDERQNPKPPATLTSIKLRPRNA